MNNPYPIIGCRPSVHCTFLLLIFVYKVPLTKVMAFQKKILPLKRKFEKKKESLKEKRKFEKKKESLKEEKVRGSFLLSFHSVPRIHYNQPSSPLKWIKSTKKRRRFSKEAEKDKKCCPGNFFLEYGIRVDFSTCSRRFWRITTFQTRSGMICGAWKVC